MTETKFYRNVRKTRSQLRNVVSREEKRYSRRGANTMISSKQTKTWTRRFAVWRKRDRCWKMPSRDTSACSKCEHDIIYWNFESSSFEWNLVHTFCMSPPLPVSLADSHLPFVPSSFSTHLVLFTQYCYMLHPLQCCALIIDIEILKKCFVRSSIQWEARKLWSKVICAPEIAPQWFRVKSFLWFSQHETFSNTACVVPTFRSITKKIFLNHRFDCRSLGCRTIVIIMELVTNLLHCSCPWSRDPGGRVVTSWDGSLSPWWRPTASPWAPAQRGTLEVSDNARRCWPRDRGGWSSSPSWPQSGGGAGWPNPLGAGSCNLSQTGWMPAIRIMMLYRKNKMGFPRKMF